MPPALFSTEDPDAAAPQARPGPAVRARRLLRTRWWAGALLVALVFAALQGIAGPRVAMNGDSVQYARVALGYLGESPYQAAVRAWDAGCVSTADAAQRITSVDPIHFRKPDTEQSSIAACRRQARYFARPDAGTRRYERIFQTRIGYPLLSVPAVAVLGPRLGLWVTTVACTALAGFLIAALLAVAGMHPVSAIAGQVVFLLCPLGQWGVHPLAEGALNAAVLLGLLGAWWLLRRRLLLGGAVCLAGLAATSVVKYSSGAIFAGALALTAAAFALTGRRNRHRGALLLGAGGVVAAVLITAGASVAGAPGSAETLQDTFTRHYHRSDVPDPWALLVELNLRFWLYFLREQAFLPLLLVLSGAGLWLLMRRVRRTGRPAEGLAGTGAVGGPARGGGVNDGSGDGTAGDRAGGDPYGDPSTVPRRRTLGWVSLAGLLLGALTICAHPVVYEYQRLGALMWLPAVLGLPLLVAALPAVRRASAARGPRAGEVAAAEPAGSPETLGASGR